MRRILERWAGTACAVMVLALAGCVSEDSGNGGEAAPPAQPAAEAPTAQAPAAQPATPMPAPADTQPGQAPPELRLEVNVAERELYAYRNDQRVGTYPVAVGTSEWPTRTGEWTIGQVIWNPEWIPPAEEWAEKEEKKAPGAADNPLGRAQLVYDAPRSVHGTNEPESLGKAASHGSIRISNANAMRLARMVMEAGGAGKDEAWYQRVRENRRERVEVPIPNPVPIRVVAGGSGGDSGSEKGSEKGGSGGSEKSGSGN